MNCSHAPVQSMDYPEHGSKPAQGEGSLPNTSPRTGALQRYTLAGLCLALALAGRLALDSRWGEQNPYVLFFVAVFVAIQLGGKRLFLVTLLAAVVLTDWFFLAPRYSLLIAGASNLIKTTIFCLLSLLMLYFTERARRALGREQRAREELRQQAAALSETQERFEHLFEGSPAPTWVEDWVALRHWLEALRHQGVVDLGAYLEEDPERVRHAVGLVCVRDVNEAALRLMEAGSKAELVASLPKLFTRRTYESFEQVLKALWADQSHIESESGCQSLEGENLDLLVRIDVPRRGAEQALDFGNVIVTATDITGRKREESEREQLVRRLQRALAEVKTLSGLLPICAHCKRIRDDQGYWNQIELYIRRHSNAKFSHGICPDCSLKLYPELFSA